MGGSIGEGNKTVSAEFNIYADPEAADVVFRSGIPITMMGLDVTHQALLDGAAVDAAARDRHALGADRRGARRVRARARSGRGTTRRRGDPRRRRGRPPGHRRTSSRSPRTTWRWTRRTGPAAAGRSARAIRAGSRARAACRTRRSASASTRSGSRTSSSTPTRACRRRPRRCRVRLRYVALGDSYTIGTSVAAAERWPNQLVGARGAGARTRREPRRQRLHLARPHRGRAAAARRARPEFVTVLIGVNDVVQGVPHATLPRPTSAAILDGAGAAASARDRALVVTTPDYTVTPAGAGYGDPAQQSAGSGRTTRSSPRLATARGIAVVDIHDISLRGRRRPLARCG